MKRKHLCWPDCPIHDWNEVEIDWKALREPFWVICDGCRKVARMLNKYMLPDGWTRRFDPCPESHHCPECSEEKAK